MPQVYSPFSGTALDEATLDDELATALVPALIVEQEGLGRFSVSASIGEFADGRVTECPGTHIVEEGQECVELVLHYRCRDIVPKLRGVLLVGQIQHEFLCPLGSDRLVGHRDRRAILVVSAALADGGFAT